MLNKEEARKEFERVTKELGVKHTFSFDDAWDYAQHKGLSMKKIPDKKVFRKGIMTFEDKLRQHPDCVTGKELDELNPLKHSFADGCYIREIFNPKGEVLVTKIHKITHPFFLMQGDMSIMTETGVKRIRAPYHGITKAGTKRIIYAHEDCVFVTVHVTKETDLKKIEDEVIAKDFKEIDDLETKKFIDVIFQEKED